MLKVPRRSVETTAEKPLGVKSRADDRKLPAAALISIVSLPKVSTVCLTAAVQSCGRRTEPRYIVQEGPRDWEEERRTGRRRPIMQTEQPWAIKRREISRPERGVRG